MPSISTIRNIEAVVVLVSAIAASVFVPSRLLVPIAAIVLAGSVGGVYAVRARMQRESAARREWLLEIGMMLGMAGLAAFIVLLVEFAD
jgi:hypothetical protein